MSILNLSPQGIIAARLCTTVLAKKEQSPKQKSKTSTRREPVGFDQLRRESTGEHSVVEDIPDLIRPSSRSSSLQAASNAADLKDPPREKSKLLVPDRGAVLKACIGASAGLSLAGFLVRQVSHSAAEGGWQVPDCTVLMPYRTELWHIVPTVGVVVLVTSLRQILLKVWPDFAQSSQAANNQVLGSLEPVDFFTVSYLSGISEEFLFRGALLPFLGPDWKGIVGTALVFGALHLSGGRNSSFAVWASFVGVVYGILGLCTSDLTTSMAAHSASNLLGAVFWKMNQSEKDVDPL